MKVKLTHEHKWIVESKDDLYILHVVTPNNHLMHIPTTPEDHEFKSHCFLQIIEKDLKPDDISEIKQICPFLEIIQYNGTAGIWCVTKQSWISDHVESTTCLIHIFNSRLIHHVLEYDRQCENTKALQIISETCSKVGGMADLLEFTRGIVNMVKEDSKNK
jgi:hypothetical protein